MSQPHRRAKELSVPCLVDVDRDQIAKHIEKGEFFWLDLEDPSDDKLGQLAEQFHLHPLTVQDARMFKQRPKLEDYGGYVFLVAFGVDADTSSRGELALREVHAIISGDYVVTIHQGPFHVLDELRHRYKTERVRSEQFLVYRILEQVTSTFFPVLSEIDDEIDSIEDEVLADPSEPVLRRIFMLKRELVAMRRVISPLRDVFARDAEQIADIRGLEADNRLYFRDLYDTLIRISELVDSYRDLLSGATDLYLSTVANRQGEVNKQLTIIATIFLPLTFLTGFFGQNFSYMINHWINTEQAFFVWGVGLLVVSLVGFMVYFRRKKWL
ncbi:MAG TPA: magnesium/cobalt transporter CorA [Solirubrobacteraceae bacterium]